MAQIAANLQRIKNGQRRYAITPRVPAGFIQPDQLQKYIDVANEFGAVLKLTGSQRIMITNLKAEDVDKAWEMLGMEPAYTVSNRVRSDFAALTLGAGDASDARTALGGVLPEGVTEDQLEQAHVLRVSATSGSNKITSLGEQRYTLRLPVEAGFAAAGPACTVLFRRTLLNKALPRSSCCDSSLLK